MQLYALPYLILVRLHRAAIEARRGDRTWRYFLWSACAGIAAAVLATFTLTMAYELWRIGWWPLSIAIVVLFAAPPFQPMLQRHVLSRLGWVRWAYWCGHLVTMTDSDAYGLACAAWAHARRPTPSGEAWLAARRDRRRPLGDTEVVVTALIAAGRGDADTARELLRSLDHIVENHPAVRELAGEWLAVDAAERGAWSEIAAPRWPATALAYFLEGVAARISRRELYARWLLAPHRRVTRALLQVEPEPQPEPEPEPDRTYVHDLPGALRAHVAVMGGGQVAAAAKAWDAALALPATHAWLSRRALELDAPPGAADRALREVAAAAADELAQLAGSHALPAGSRGLVGDPLARRLRHGRLDQVEQRFARWADRRTTGDVRVPIDEWREWCALRAAYDTAVAAGGLELRRLAFPHAYTTGTSMAVWLWNSRKEYALSHAISKWLLGEALAVGDAEAIDVCTRNSRLAVPTRLGVIRP